MWASRTWAAVVAASVVAACQFDGSGLGLESRDAGDLPTQVDGAPQRPDAGGGGDPDARACDSPLSFEPSNFHPCDVPTPVGAGIDLGSGTWVLDTDDATLGLEGLTGAPLEATAVVSQHDAPDILLVALDELRVGSNAVLIAEGSRALAIVSGGDIRVDNWLFAGARGDRPGAGALATVCAGGTGAAGETQTVGGRDGGSGGGGGYGEAGGAGAIVPGSGGSVSAGGQPGGGSSLTPLRGGCPGGGGGAQGGVGGGGGGALQLVAEGRVRIDGLVTARGGGGGGAQVPGGGGGGGGSGGAILIEASEIDIRGNVMAQGGGGGEGSRAGPPWPGNPGTDGYSTHAIPAPGGSGGSSGGDGGNGGIGGLAAQDGLVGTNTGANAAGGGGGGGGVGRVRLRSISSAPFIDGSAILSPAPL